jgi:hypothetical protein
LRNARKGEWSALVKPIVVFNRTAPAIVLAGQPVWVITARDGVSPEPIAVLIPSAVVTDTEFRKDVLVKEERVSPEITQIYGNLVWLETFCLCLGQEHGLGCFAGYGAVVEVNRVVVFVLQRNHDHGVVGHFLINSDIDA